VPTFFSDSLLHLHFRYLFDFLHASSFALRPSSLCWVLTTKAYDDDDEPSVRGPASEFSMRFPGFEWLVLDELTRGFAKHE
jgi:hypothetical protein